MSLLGLPECVFAHVCKDLSTRDRLSLDCVSHDAHKLVSEKTNMWETFEIGFYLLRDPRVVRFMRRVGVKDLTVRLPETHLLTPLLHPYKSILLAFSTCTPPLRTLRLMSPYTAGPASWPRFEPNHEAALFHEIARCVPTIQHASLLSVRAFASGLDDVSILVNNAGLMAPSWRLTADGFEETWQVNALAPFLLTSLLLPGLRRRAASTGDARVISVGSRLEKTGTLAELDSAADVKHRFCGDAASFNTFKNYGTSKASLTSYTLELARREADVPGLSVNLCTPGMVNSDLSRFAPAWLRAISIPLRWALLRTVEKRAETPLWLATTEKESVRSGGYYSDKAEIEVSAAARDPDVAKRLWDLLSLQTGVPQVA